MVSTTSQPDISSTSTIDRRFPRTLLLAGYIFDAQTLVQWAQHLTGDEYDLEDVDTVTQAYFDVKDIAWRKYGMTIQVAGKKVTVEDMVNIVVTQSRDFPDGCVGYPEDKLPTFKEGARVARVREVMIKEAYEVTRGRIEPDLIAELLLGLQRKKLGLVDGLAMYPTLPFPFTIFFKQIASSFKPKATSKKGNANVYGRRTAEDCPKRLLEMGIMWPMLCLSLQAVILVAAVVRLFDVDRSLPKWNHLLLYLFFIVSTYCSLIVLPCPKHSALRLAAGVFALGQTTFFVSSIIFTGDLNGTGLYGSFLRGVGETVLGVGEALRLVALGVLAKAKCW
ncbi:hypothetical protein CPB85DRAFT_1458237 [Mucidula mucida]|nr:hypothetical protein CPB85DRAFT_1458237 [Mucidula mucida]